MYWSKLNSNYRNLNDIKYVYAENYISYYITKFKFSIKVSSKRVIKFYKKKPTKICIELKFNVMLGICRTILYHLGCTI